MRLAIYQVDAFADAVFGGNPAAVVPLDSRLPDDTLRAIAAENNLSETAFYVRERDGYALRWFTPTAEVDLCGHATLAAAFIILSRERPENERVAFATRQAGVLTVVREGDRLAMDFPARPATPAALDEALFAALGGSAPREVRRAPRDDLVIYDDAAALRALAPDMARLARHGRPVIVTAPGEPDVDFVSRFFAPSLGVPEDPVTGSAHCTLVPYWAARLGRTALTARQVSARGGRLWCRVEGARVVIAGHAVLYLEGTIHV